MLFLYLVSWWHFHLYCILGSFLEQTIDDRFILVWAMNTTHASQTDYVAPMAEVDDGYFHIIFLRANVSRCSALGMFLGMEDGSHVKSDYLEYVKTRSLRLTPERLGHRRGGILDIDGEEKPYGPIQMEILRAFLKVHSPTK